MAAHFEGSGDCRGGLADEDCVHRGLHVVVDAASAGPFEQRECTVMGVEHHFLRLAWIGAHEQHPAVAKPNMGDLHDHRHAVQQDDFVAPVELVGFPGSKAQRHVGHRRRFPMLFGPPPLA
jgi:hypothetical protein